MSERAAHVRVPANFDLAETLDCGQAFRWRQSPEEPGLWEGAAFGKALSVRQAGGKLELFCSQEDFEGVWREYFDLNEDYAALREALSAMDPVLAQAAAFAPGIHILRQDPWEALCSFILSQNNHIGRIKGIIQRFCELFGARIEGSAMRAFPDAETVAALSAEDLEPLRCGYRALYVLDAAKQVADGAVDLDKIKREPAACGREALRKIKGVGPKVAECALLYGFHKTECFPMDVWMKRAMGTLLPGKRPEDFGPYAGLAQQYLFHYSRVSLGQAGFQAKSSG